ncbi:hypothetical protein ACLOJK_017248 [Asimina triloba]
MAMGAISLWSYVYNIIRMFSTESTGTEESGCPVSTSSHGETSKLLPDPEISMPDLKKLQIRGQSTPQYLKVFFRQLKTPLTFDGKKLLKTVSAKCDLRKVLAPSTVGVIVGAVIKCIGEHQLEDHFAYLRVIQLEKAKADKIRAAEAAKPQPKRPRANINGNGFRVTGIPENFHRGPPERYPYIYDRTYMYASDSHCPLSVVRPPSCNLLPNHGPYFGNGYQIGWYLSISGNFLSGSIPFQIGNLLHLQEVLDLSHILFSGVIPHQLGKLQALEKLNLSHISLTGSISPVFAHMISQSSIDLSYNVLEGSLLDYRAFQLAPLEASAGIKGLCGNFEGNQLQTLRDPSIFAGIFILCGPPLTVKCSGDEIGEIPAVDGDEEVEDRYEEMWVYVAIQQRDRLHCMGMIRKRRSSNGRMVQTSSPFLQQSFLFLKSGEGICMSAGAQRKTFGDKVEQVVGKKG